jgi:membrane protease YdiL (CAAX protease family)
VQRQFHNERRRRAQRSVGVVTFGPDHAAAPATSHPAPPSHRVVAGLIGTILLLVGVTLAHRLGPAHAGLFVAPPVAALLLLLARYAGLSWEDLGIARRTWRRGIAYAAAAIVLVAAAYAVAAVLPATRSVFLDTRYHLPTATGMLTAFIIVPIGTVLPEEVAFRGVLFGLVRRHRGGWIGAGISSALFGLWHVVPSLGLSDVNPGVRALVGHGVQGQIAGVVAATLFTGAVGLLFCELRRRSGSLLASAGLHWAANALGVVVAMLVWRS